MDKWLNKGLIFCIILCQIVGYAQDYSNSKSDEFINDFIDSVTVSKGEKQFEKELGTKYVRMIYLVPSDSVVKPEYLLCLENAARHLQYWYYDALGLDKTFVLYNPIVEVYQTSHNSCWYSTHPNGSDFFWSNVLQDGFLLTGGMFNDPNNRWVFYIDADNGCDQCGGCGGGGVAVIAANDLRGLAGYELNRTCPSIVHSYPPCRYVGGLGHELGHALGLPHPPSCPAEDPHCWDHDLMMYGYITYPDAFFNEEDKTRLNNSPFIRDIDLEGMNFSSSCDILTDTCNISTVTEVSIPFGDSIFLEGAYQKVSGVYYDTLHAEEDCDTIVISILSIFELLPPVAEDITVCAGEPVPPLTAIGENIKWYCGQNVPYGELIDNRDSQKYKTTVINDQVWMGENLNYYTPIGSYYYNDDSTSYANIYGRLYNWKTAMENCPVNWKLPGLEDWNELTEFLGGYEVAGSYLKEPGTEYWLFPNTAIVNDYKFSALPGGWRSHSGEYADMNTHAKFWTAFVEYFPTIESYEALELELYYNSGERTGDLYSLDQAFSVRCILENDSVGTGNIYNTGLTEPGTYTYYVTQTINGIESERKTVTLTINYTPPPLAEDVYICEGERTTWLQVKGENITWYDNAELTNTLGTGNKLHVYSISEVGIYPFYVTQNITNCESLPDTLIYAISCIPHAPIAEDLTICKGETDPILVANGENINWYRDFDSTSFFIDSRDGQEYKGVRIGDQIWMAENMNYYTSSGSDYYNNDSVSYAAVYGRLYSPMILGKVCPTGWHVPSIYEWEELIDYLGGDSLAGGKLKEESLTYWKSPNEGATNESGFTALPGGYYGGWNQNFMNLGENAYFYTSTDGVQCLIAIILSYDKKEADEYYEPEHKASLRCIKDDLNQFVVDDDTLIVMHCKEGIYRYYASQTILNCESPLDTVTLAINPVPPAPVSSDTTVCGVDNVPELTATGENIRWYSDAGLTDLLHSGNVFYGEQTQTRMYTYFVTQTITNCEGPADTVYLTVYSVPKVDLGPDTTINDQQDITIGVSENENQSYLWNNGSDEASIIISGQEAGVGDHSYSLIVTDSNSCENSDTVVIHVEHFNAVPYTYERGSIKIYPNPTGEFLNISFEDIHDKEVLIRVNNISGKEMIHKTYEFLSDKDILKLNISNLPDGIYYIGIIGEKIKFSGSFIKK